MSSATSAGRRLSRSTARKRCSISPRDSSVGRVLVRDGLVRVLGRDAAGLAVEGRAEEQRSGARPGTRRTRRSTAGRKPMSSMRSASSRTRISTFDSEIGVAGEQVLEATRGRDDHVRRAGVLDLLLEADAAVDGGDADARGPRPSGAARRRSGSASSRVGASTSAAMPRCFGSSGSTVGAPKAIVLPEPVGDLARTSRPASTSSMTRAWMANGDSMPFLASAPTTGCDRPRSAKDF